MNERHLHIISFDIPYPPTYGGAIDVFYRVKALAEMGVKITLHCFYKGSLQRSEALEQLCEHVYYYPRKTSFREQLHILPYGVGSRTHNDLLHRLLADDAPIIFEGLVSCGLMSHPALRARRKYFRECNVEHDYYHALGRASKSIVKKLFFHIEAERLRRFERCLQYTDGIFALAHQDETYFKQHYTCPTAYIPCFHGNKLIAKQDKTDQPFILYHGNLSVAENSKAAFYIAEHLANNISEHIVIAGKNPPQALKRALAQHANITLIESPDEKTMDQLIQNARVHLLITFQATGIKLKLINVLYSGGHVIVNPTMVAGTDLEALCHVGHNDPEWISLCSQYIRLPLSAKEREQRQTILDNTYSDEKSARQLYQIIFP